MQLDGSSCGRQGGRLINSHPLHFLPAGEQDGQSEKKEGERETVNELVSKGEAAVRFHCLWEVVGGWVASGGRGGVRRLDGGG